MTPVLDASAVLALIYREPGHEVVAELLDGSVISTVNWAEIVQKLAHFGHPAPREAAEGVSSLGALVLPFTEDAAVRAAELWPTTRTAGLSLGDRSCLAVADGLPDGVAVTADRVWADLDLDVTVELIR